MKIVLLSDTHGQEVKNLPSADLLIHSGDWSSRGTFEEHNKFVVWMLQIRMRYKKVVIVPGNHDRYSYENTPLVKDEFQKIGIDFLVDEPTFFQGQMIHGMPWTPEFGNWAWMTNDIERDGYCYCIDPNTNILVTHGPPKGYLDELGFGSSEPGANAGCQYLREAIDRIKPTLHTFGHIHEAAGIQVVDKTLLVNASCMDEHYRLVNGFKVVYI